MPRRGRPKNSDVLTPREWEVLSLIRDGLSNREIAERLGVTLAGAKYHVSEIISKLGVSSREEAVRAAAKGKSGGLPGIIGILLPSKAGLVKGGLVSAGAMAVAGLALLFLLALDSRTDDAAGALGKVAYIQDGNLWVKSLPSGPARQLTHDGTASRPQWSASGEWLLFSKGPPALPDEIGARLIRADGSAERGLEGAAAWSPVADVLAFTQEDSRLFVENADGTGRRELLPPVLDRNFNPLDRRLQLTWSSDGQWIVFQEHHADHARAAAYTYVGVRAIRLDGSDEREIFSAAISPQGLPDGPFPALWAASGGGAPAFMSLVPPGPEPPEAEGVPLNLMALLTRSEDGAGVRMLTYDDFIAPSPDSERLALVAGVDLQTIPVAEGARSVPPVDSQSKKGIVVIDVGSGAVRALTDSTIVAVSPSWSPNGEAIAFVARPETGPVSLSGSRSEIEWPRRLWTMAGDGSNAHPIETSGADCRQERPQWSADGAQILFACMDTEPGASLRLVPASGGEAIEVVPRISPESQANSFLTGYQGHIDWDYLYDWWRSPP